ncbi:hypothetical protein D3C72_1997250 [compost metagenome]
MRCCILLEDRAMVSRPCFTWGERCSPSRISINFEKPRMALSGLRRSCVTAELKAPSSRLAASSSAVRAWMRWSRSCRIETFSRAIDVLSASRWSRRTW